MQLIKDRAYYETRYQRARRWILIISAIIAADTVQVLLGGASAFSFCMSAPTCFAARGVAALYDPADFLFRCSVIGMDFIGEAFVAPIAIGLFVLAGVWLLASFFSWLHSKKDGRWMTAALILFLVDCLWMVFELVWTCRVDQILDVSFSVDFVAVLSHGLMLYASAVGVHAWKNRNELPEMPDAPLDAATSETADAATPETADAATPETADAATSETADAATPETADAAGGDGMTESTSA